MNNRRINFQGIQNVRDLGGLLTADGHIIAPGLLFRSANLAEATQADIRNLHEKQHLAKVIDLRTEMERSERPDAELAEHVVYLPIPVFDERVAGISHEKNSGANQAGAIIPKMENLYRMMVTEESCRRNLSKAARCVMEHNFAEGSVLWHCTEGKDRCGLLTAVLLSALGVDRRQIMEDYLLTNEVNEPKAEIYYQRILAAGRSETEAAAVKDTFLAKQSYLDAAFSAIDEQYPDMDTYLCEGLYISNTTIEVFRKDVLF